MSLHQAYRGGHKDRPGWWLHFDYDETIVDYLKAYKHDSQRQWDEEKKRWWIAEEIADQVAVFLPGFEAYLRQRSLL